jgi:Cytochrome P460
MEKIMRLKRILASAVVAGLVIGWGSDGAIGGKSKEAPQFEDRHTLLRPSGYREWVFVGSSLGLQYAKDPDANRPNAARDPASEVYHNVYINPASYRGFVKTGQFPDGTVMILELANSAVKREPGLQGSFQKDFIGLEASVKDSKRFASGWAYFSFDGPKGMLKEKAQPFSDEECWSCHHQKAATDHVFTQFYPVLRSARPSGPAGPRADYVPGK